MSKKKDETTISGWVINTGVQYLGDGSSYVEGVPARDLTRTEWQGLRGDLRDLALATGLYHDPDSEQNLVNTESV